MSETTKPLERGQRVKKFLIGGVEVIGLEGDFREAEPVKIRPEFEDRREKLRKARRRDAVLNPLEKIYNRYHRMKSYWFDRNVDFRLTEAEYRELWDTAPNVVTPDGEVVAAKDYADRRSKVSARIVDKKRRVVDRNNIALYYQGKIIHTL